LLKTPKGLVKRAPGWGKRAPGWGKRGASIPDDLNLEVCFNREAKIKNNDYFSDANFSFFFKERLELLRLFKNI
jgi:hypothetical protein